MKTIRFSLACFFCLFFLIEGAFAQSCYVRMDDDASGYTPTAEQLAELEQAAAELCVAFDSAGFGGQFKVYDFGFYLHQEVTEGGYPEPFAQKIEEVAALSPYYLLFGKQTDKIGGVYSNFWVNLKLPDTSSLSCITSARERLFEAKILQVVLNAFKPNPDNYAKAEVLGMNKLRTVIDSVRVGNCCPFNTSEIRAILKNLDYFSLPAKFMDIPVAVKQNDTYKRSTGLVEDYADLLCEIQGVPNLGYADFSYSLEQDILTASNYGVSAIGYITKDDNICESIGNDILTGFEDSGYEALIHFHYSPSGDTIEPGELLIKVEAIEYSFPEVVITAPFNFPCGPYPLPSPYQNIQSYAIKKDAYSLEYFGYNLVNEEWQKGDLVEHTAITPWDPAKNEHTWNDRGAGIIAGPLPYEVIFYPSFLAWLGSEAPGAEVLFTTTYLETYFHFFLTKGLPFNSEKNTVFQKFKYPNINPPFILDQGTTLEWACDSRLCLALHDVESAISTFDKIDSLLLIWLLINENLNGIINGIDWLGQIEPIPFKSYPSGNTPLWASQLFGGTRGRTIAFKKFELSPHVPFCSRAIEIEMVFTVHDNFGVGMDDAKKWFLPGVIEQWILQHYRNFDSGCDRPPCYVPITSHKAYINHKYNLCIPN